MTEQAHHPAFPQPSNSHAHIWRFLTRNKFEWMVSESRLFMPNAAHLGDPLEGTQPRGDAGYWQRLIDSAATEEQKRTIEHNQQLISSFVTAFRTRYYVSCWHLNDALNPDMWNLYAENSESVAVRTTVSKLREALPVYINIGVVRYIDYTTAQLSMLNMLEYITYKNKIFEHANEIRAVAMHPIVEGQAQQHFRENHYESDSDPNFLVFAPLIQLADLVDLVLVHPKATKQFFEEMLSLCHEKGLPVPERAVW